MAMYDSSKVKAVYIGQSDGTSKKYVPEKHGKWMQDKAAEIQYRYNCSECGNPIYDKIRPYKYCPHCGARMDGE